MKEEWRDIKGYEGKYKVSNLGRVYSFYKRECLEPGEVKGYLQVSLYKNGKRNIFNVHRLVALHFIPNSNNYKEVNHKDENKQNNRVDNLEWCDRKYNQNYGSRTQRASEKSSITQKINGKNKGSKHPRARKVQCVTTGKKFNCIKEAGEYYFISKEAISHCCRGKQKSAGRRPDTGEKLVWRYLD